MATYLPHTSDAWRLTATIDKIERLTSGLDFDSVLVRGLSGIVPASIFCYNTHKGLVILRKESESYHGVHVEGPDGWKERGYIILDDFIDTGLTIQRLVEAGLDYCGTLPRGVVLFAENNKRNREILVYRQRVILTPTQEGVYTVAYAETQSKIE